VAGVAPRLADARARGCEAQSECLAGCLSDCSLLGEGVFGVWGSQRIADSAAVLAQSRRLEIPCGSKANQIIELPCL
jgi:hypothetical protein